MYGSNPSMRLHVFMLQVVLLLVGANNRAQFGPIV